MAPGLGYADGGWAVVTGLFNLSHVIGKDAPLPHWLILGFIGGASCTCSSRPRSMDNERRRQSSDAAFTARTTTTRIGRQLVTFPPPASAATDLPLGAVIFLPEGCSTAFLFLPLHLHEKPCATERPSPLPMAMTVSRALTTSTWIATFDGCHHPSLQGGYPFQTAHVSRLTGSSQANIVRTYAPARHLPRLDILCWPSFCYTAVRRQSDRPHVLVYLPRHDRLVRRPPSPSEVS